MEDRPVRVVVEDRIDGITRVHDVGTWASLWSPGIVIGSSPDCSIVIDAAEVRPIHARVRGLGHHLVVEAEGGSVTVLGREIPTGRLGRINGLGPPVAPLGIDRFSIRIVVVEAAPPEVRRRRWKFW